MRWECRRILTWGSSGFFNMVIFGTIKKIKHSPSHHRNIGYFARFDETRDKNNGPLLKNCFYDPAGERNQARQTLRFYRLLFSHPSVEAITWRLHDPSYSELSGLLRSDLSPKPAYNTQMNLLTTNGTRMLPRERMKKAR